MNAIEKRLKESFICKDEDYCTLSRHKNAPLYRKIFNVADFKSAKIYILGLGLYELFVNGAKITKGKFAPYISNPNHYAYYDKYDITSLLKKGDNILNVLLGNGFLNSIGGFPWEFDKAEWRRSPCLSLVLIIDGKIAFSSDDTFETKDSHIIFDDIRCGEYIDNNFFFEKDYCVNNDTSWQKAKPTTAVKGELRLCKVESIKPYKKLKPKRIIEKDGGIIFDFGVNSAGIVRLRIKGKKSQKISLWHCETLLNGEFFNKNTCTPDFDCSISQKDIFICSGKEDVFEPSFTYHGFRYVFCEGLNVSDDYEIEALLLSSKIKRVGSFKCSDKKINKLQKLTVNSDLSNFYYFPTDCPQREKNGWTADASLSCEQLLYNFDCKKSLIEWLYNIRKSQREDGQIPGVVPTYQFGYEWGCGPNWDSVLIELPYGIYRFSGDKKVIKDNIESIYKYFSVNIKNKINTDGLVAFGLPDWCEAGGRTEGDVSTPIEITDSLICIEMLDKAIKMADVIKDTEKVQKLKEIKDGITESFIKKYIKNGVLTCETQTAYAMAISVGIFDKNSEMAVKRLLNVIKRDKNVLKVGVIGNKYLFDILTESGNGDLAIKLITQNKFPSYNYWLKHGATSLWEAFNELEDNGVLRKDGGRVLSLNHHFWGTISAFFYKRILGINVNPDLKDCSYIEIEPCLIGSIKSASGKYKNKYGSIELSWERVNGEIKYDVKTTGNLHFLVKK